MQLFHICTKKEYEENGEKKIKWYKAGIFKISERGRKYIRFFHQPMTDYFVIDNDPVKETIQIEN